MGSKPPETEAQRIARVQRIERQINEFLAEESQESRKQSKARAQE